jgi:flagellar protein FlaG
MLIIGGVVAAFGVFNSVYPAVERSSQAVSSAADAVNDRMTSQIQIIQVGDSGTTVDAWVKNVGSSRVAGIENSDVFFGMDGGIARVAFGDNGSSLPYWTYQIEGGNAQWAQATTNRITIHLASSPAPGVYLLKVVIPNGVFDEATFSVN